MKQISQILAPLALVIILAAGLSSCGEGISMAAAPTPSPTAPLTEADVKLNAYEKLTNQYVKAARRLKGGDMSVTLTYIDLDKSLKEETAKMQQETAKMTPLQVQRFSRILGESAPYVQ